MDIEGFATASYQNRVVYITGGTNSAGYTMNEVYMYDVWSNSISNVVAMNKPRKNHSSVTAGSNLVVIGGREYSAGKRLDTLEIL